MDQTMQRPNFTFDFSRNKANSFETKLPPPPLSSAAFFGAYAESPATSAGGFPSSWSR
jgi:hypothetical protein